MGKYFKRYAALGFAVVLLACAAVAQAEKTSSTQAPVIYIPAPKPGGFVWHGEGGGEAKVEVTINADEPSSTARHSYLVTSLDKEIRYCVPSVKAGSISVSGSPKAAMKMVGTGDRQECRIYFDTKFEFVYEPRFEKGKRVFADEIRLDFYGGDGQWICEKSAGVYIVESLTPPGGYDMDVYGGWKLLGITEH